jgi:hypothetical protein
MAPRAAEVFGGKQISKADELNEYRMSNKEFRMMKFDAFVKSQGTAFRSWFDTSPRTENQILTVYLIRSP